MPQTHSKNRLLRKILQSSLSLLKAIFQGSANLIRFATQQLLFELSLATLVIGLSYLFTTWEISLNIALILAIAITLGLFLFAVCIFYKLAGNKRPTANKYRGEIGLARLISQTVAERNTQWHEYQDWLHDIMLSRRQLLDNKHPRWKVSLITYWRLSIFCVVVAINKVKQVAFSISRSR